jgi:hypothetical protein
MRNRSLFSLIITTIIALIGTTVWAQTPARSAFEDFSFGFAVEQLKQDFGFSAEVTSPYFLWGHAAVTADASYALREGRLDSSPSATALVPYWILRVGSIGVVAVLNDNIRLYGYGGVLFVLPDASFSSAQFVFGGYGGFGFEFFTPVTDHFGISYFIELGTSGAPANAELMDGDPSYMSGFNAEVGLKIYL